MNAPRAWPKRWASTSVSGSVVQSTVTKGAVPRGLLAWSARAKSSLPTPVSPTISTLTLLAAASRTCSRASFRAGLSPIMSGWRRRVGAASPRLARQATAWESASFSSRGRKGLSRYSHAPARRAVSAASALPCPVITMTSGCPGSRVKLSSVARPSPSGRSTSSRMMSMS